VILGFSANVVWYFGGLISDADHELFKGLCVVVSCLAIFSRLFLNSSQVSSKVFHIHFSVSIRNVLF